MYMYKDEKWSQLVKYSLKIIRNLTWNCGIRAVVQLINYYSEKGPTGYRRSKAVIRGEKHPVGLSIDLYLTFLTDQLT